MTKMGKRNEVYYAVDLFAGIGGIRLGFENSFKDRIKINFVAEIDKKAQITYMANFNSPDKIHEDITKLTDAEIDKLDPFDICMAGFPCQAFSMAGKQEGFKDSRGKLFCEIIRICKKKRPMVILCENVKGLNHHDNGKTLEKIKTELNNIGYEERTEILNSKNFNVPQSRERLYIVAFRNDINIDDFKFPESFRRRDRKLKSILEKHTVGTRYYMSARYLKTLEEHKEKQKAKGNGYGYVIRTEDGIAGTLMCGGTGKERNLIVDKRRTDFTPTTNIRGPVNDKSVRRLTPREWARLQGFGDDFIINRVAETHQYDQLGNTVTVPAIQAIANNILKIIDAHLSRGGKRSTEEDNGSVDNLPKPDPQCT